MDEIEDPANHRFLEDINFPQTQLANLMCGRALTSLASGRKRPHLDSWFEGHRGDQYPTKEVVSALAAKENLTCDKAWMRSCNIMSDSDLVVPNSYPAIDTRAQARSDSGIRHDLRGEHSPSLEEGETVLSLVEKLISCPSTSPIKQYTMTPPREDGSTIQTSLSVQNDKGPPRFTKRSSSYSSMGYRPTNGSTVMPQMIDSGTGTAQGPDMAFSTTSSLHRSQELSITGGEKPTLPQRQKGKRVGPPKKYPLEREDKKIYQCPQCNLGHRFLSDWARHLEIHNPQRQYTCMLQGRKVTIRGKVACPFCNASDPTQDHLSTHNVSQCADKAYEERTYRKRDHMLGHMKRIHNSSVRIPPDAWMTIVHENQIQQFWCGFRCGILKTTWDLWLQHLKVHFKVDDFDMTKWTFERKCLPSLADDFPHSIGPSHSIDPAHATRSIHPRSSPSIGVYPHEFPSHWSRFSPGSF